MYYKLPDVKLNNLYGKLYICNHPCYSQCTLYTKGEKGIAVIQQRYDPRTKHTWWTSIDPWLADDIYLSPGFQEFLTGHSDIPNNGIYPTFTVRQVMRRLHIPPLVKEPWETRF